MALHGRNSPTVKPSLLGEIGKTRLPGSGQVGA